MCSHAVFYLLGRCFLTHYIPYELISVRMSSTRHAVILDDNLTGLGYVPDLTPVHHVDLLTGNNFKTSGNLKKPVWESCVCVMSFTSV